MAGIDTKNGIILWVLGGTGILFLYSAYKGVTPASVIESTLNPATSVTHISSGISTRSTTADRPMGLTTGYTDNGRPIAMPAPTIPGPKQIPRDSSHDRPAPNYRKELDGVNYIYNADGVEVAPIPAAYQNNPDIYLPPTAYFPQLKLK